MYLKRDVKKLQEGGAVDPAMAGGAPAPETDAAAAGGQPQNCSRKSGAADRHQQDVLGIQKAW